MKVSHEVPLCLLEESLKFNDFHYLLPHYYEKYEQYRNFYIKHKKDGVIIDNGLFEGGVLPDDVLLRIIKTIDGLIEPNIFIVPDAWNDAHKTYNFAEEWMDKLTPLFVKPMVVLQGNSLVKMQDLIYNCYKLGIRAFALNHSSVTYQKLFPHKNPLIAGMMGRIMVFQRLIEDDVFDNFKNCYIHFLGVNLPQEIMLLGDLKKHINSIDTSNPVITGALGWKYTDLGLLDKPKQKIEVFMESLDFENKDIIFRNIEKFRSWV